MILISRWVQLLVVIVALMVAACTGPASTSITEDPLAEDRITTSTTSDSLVVDDDGVDTPVSTPSFTAPTPEPDEDVATFLVRCYAEFGIVAENLAEKFPGQNLGAAAIGFPGNPPQDALYEAGQQCAEAAMAAGLMIDLDDPEQVRVLFADAVQLYECLVEHDYPVPALPSEEVFVEEKGGWDPWSAMNPGTRPEASEACPSDHYGVLDLSDVDVGD